MESIYFIKRVVDDWNNICYTTHQNHLAIELVEMEGTLKNEALGYIISIKLTDGSLTIFEEAVSFSFGASNRKKSEVKEEHCQRAIGVLLTYGISNLIEKLSIRENKPNPLINPETFKTIS